MRTLQKIFSQFSRCSTKFAKVSFLEFFLSITREVYFHEKMQNLKDVKGEDHTRLCIS